MINPETPQSRGNDRPPSPDEMFVCKPYLDRQIAIIKPGCIVALGSVASKILLGIDRTIGSIRGKWYDYPVELFNEADAVKVLPTYHPAALLRNPSLKRQTWEDMKMLKSFLEKIDKNN
jgi:DNA polymerase